MPETSTKSDSLEGLSLATEFTDHLEQTKTVFILRRNSGSGGAEKAAERLACQLEKHFTVHRMWAGRQWQGKVIPVFTG